MQQAGIDSNSGRAGRSALFGADLVMRGWEHLTLNRVDGPPLKFVGCRQSLHWQRLYGQQVVSLALWMRRKSGYVLAFTVCVDGALQDDCVVVDSLREAITFLEDYCALPPPLSSDPPGLDALLKLQKTAHFNQAFAALVGEALAAWMDFDLDTRRDRRKHKASA